MQKKCTSLFFAIVVAYIMPLYAQDFRQSEPVTLPDLSSLRIAGVVNNHVLVFCPPAAGDNKAAFYIFSREGKLLGRTQPVITALSEQSSIQFWQTDNQIQLFLQNPDALYLYRFDENGNPVQQTFIDRYTDKLQTEPYRLVQGTTNKPAALYRFFREAQGNNMQWEYRMLDGAGKPGPRQLHTLPLSYNRWIPGDVIAHPEGYLLFTLSRIPMGASDSALTVLYRSESGTPPLQLLKVSSNKYDTDIPFLKWEQENGRILMASVYYDRETRSPLGIRTVSISPDDQGQSPDINWHLFAAGSNSRSVDGLAQAKPILRSVYRQTGSNELGVFLDAIPAQKRGAAVYQTFSESNPALVSNLTPSAEIEMMRRHVMTQDNAINNKPEGIYPNGQPYIAPVPDGYGGGAYNPSLSAAYVPPSSSGIRYTDDTPEKINLLLGDVLLKEGKAQVQQQASVKFSPGNPARLWVQHTKSGSLYLNMGNPSRLVLTGNDSKLQSLKLKTGFQSSIFNGFLEQNPTGKTIWVLSRTEDDRLSLGWINWE